MNDKEYKNILKQYHSLSGRHILVAETDMSYPDALKVVAYSDRLRKAGNELVSLMCKNFNQLVRTKKYRKLLKLYGNATDGKQRKQYGIQLREMQEAYNLTFAFCYKSMIHIRQKYGIDSVFGLTKAEDVWRGMEKCLYDNGKTLHFSKYGELLCIRAKQINRGIPLSVKDGNLRFKFHGIEFGIKTDDRFQNDEVNAVLAYLASADEMDKKAVDTFLEYGYCIDTYRPCYVTLV